MARIRRRYSSFRELLLLNNECLECMAGLQEDLQYILPRRDVIGDRVAVIFTRAEGIVSALEALTGLRSAQLGEALRDQRSEVERYIAASQELAAPRLAVWLSEISRKDAAEVGDKAAALGEIKHKLDLRVPDGYVLTTAAYRQFCGNPLWTAIRDVMRAVDPGDLDALHTAGGCLQTMVATSPVPRALEVAISERARALDTGGLGLAVRSSAVGEGGERTFAGQFLSLINVPRENAVEAYREVVAGRFSASALAYRLSGGLLEVDSPMAVLVLPVIRARASGILYTRDPGNPKSNCLWITATRGLGLDIASGKMPADLFILSRNRPHAVVERQITHKDEQIVAQPDGGLAYQRLDPGACGSASISDADLSLLAEWGTRIEAHFGAPQDVEWALDEEGRLWILQARPLALVELQGARKPRARAEPLLCGGRTVYPGQVSGPAYLAEDLRSLGGAPDGALVFLRKASPEIVTVLPRIAGLVAEWGNITGHAAALLREFRVPSVFLMKGGFERLTGGQTVSLDAVQTRLYGGDLFGTRRSKAAPTEQHKGRAGDPVSRRLLTLNLLDPTAADFRPAGCRSTHDVLRYCHEKAVEAMFAVNDLVLEEDRSCSKKLESSLPLNIHVLDLGGGIAPECAHALKVAPQQIVCRPFRSLWSGISHPEVTWVREMPASLGDLAAVMARVLTPQEQAMRGLGERSYLLVAEEYMNFNSRLAYHFTLVDACLSDSPSMNYISFRFAGGGSSFQRRSLRTCFIEACLTHYGFRVDRRGDLLNAWYKKGPPEETGAMLDILGRLVACCGQLDMYMSSPQVMKWYVRQFLEGNYSFHREDGARN